MANAISHPCIIFELCLLIPEGSFEPDAFHIENYIELPTNVGVSFINKKAPVRRLFEPEAFHLLFTRY